MVQAFPASVGQSLDEVETPALMVDLDAYEGNLNRMAAALEGRAVRLRPHAKTHKSPVIALEQIARGAVGQCCQKVVEAEALVAGGVPDVLVSNQVVGPSKIARLAALAGRARLAACVDDARNVADLSAAMAAAGVTLRVLVEIEVGMRRCGVAPGAPALALARQVAESPGLVLGGASRPITAAPSTSARWRSAARRSAGPPRSPPTPRRYSRAPACPARRSAAAAPAACRSTSSLAC